MRSTAWFGIAASLLVAVPAAAEPVDCRLAIAETVQAAAAISGDVFRLADGREVRLASILAPGRGLEAETIAAASAEAAARAALDRHVAGKPVGLSPLARRLDRWGRTLAHVALGGGTDPLALEFELLREGHARVAASHRNRDCLGRLLSAEAEARERSLGLWADPYYSVQRADDAASLAGLAGTYLVAEGTVASVRVSGATLYLNFSRRWRDGLSVTVWKPYAARFAGGEDGLRGLQGQRVRVRGWLSAEGALLLAASYAEQIERLTGEEPKRRD